jgi:hypothetical protein
VENEHVSVVKGVRYPGCRGGSKSIEAFSLPPPPARAPAAAVPALCGVAPAVWGPLGWASPSLVNQAGGK